jgi:hypothetical protein
MTADPDLLGYYFKPIEKPIWDWEEAFMSFKPLWSFVFFGDAISVHRL